VGISGRIARAFLNSKLTPLATLASLAVGVLAVIATPREEEPQISVPMIDVIVALPGAAPRETENLLARPIEQRMWEIPGVDYVYGMAGDGYALVTVRFLVGEDQDRSVARVHAKLASVMDEAPAGALPPLVRPHTIDDVPIVTLTIHSGAYDSNELRALAARLQDEVRTLADVAATTVTGGNARQLSVLLDPARLATHGVSPGEVAHALRGANARLQAGELVTAGEVLRVDIGAPLSAPDDVGAVVVSARSGAPVYVRDVAVVVDDHGERSSYVAHRGGGYAESQQAVTLSVAKRPGANATKVAHAVLQRVEQARGRLLPADVEVTITRNYGETAAEKARELILHLLIATVSVTVLIGVFLGWREALVVLVAVPVTLGLTLFVYYAMGYTLNRITLFALIFSIGILVDDAIVVVENIYRHMKMGDRPAEAAAVEGVEEVGNPTILATFTVIAAILPMAFVSGLMGPYMRPIPVGASVAMLASLAVAFIVTPYLALRLLRNHVVRQPRVRDAAHEPEEGASARIYGRIMTPLMDSARLRHAFYGGVVVLLLLAVGMLAVRMVQVKMLPFDNKSEFQVILDLPEGTTLETSFALAQDVAAYLHTVDEVEHTQVYAGTAAPFNFNGLVRHYFMRSGGHVADVQVNLKSRHDRKRQSHDIAVAVRPAIDSIARSYGARSKIAEIPPGPPVLSTLVAEIYAADDNTRMEAAQRVLDVFETTPGVVDVDWTLEAPQQQRTFVVDRVLAARAGASVEQITQTLYLALSGAGTGAAPAAEAREQVAIVPRLALPDRSSLEALLVVPVATMSGPQPLGRFVRVQDGVRESARMRKNMRPVIYITGDVAGSIESPVYAILDMNRRLDDVRVDGAEIARYNAVQPERLDELAMKWDGEWQVTIEVFRDLGLAFAAVLLLIYALVVGWFQSFRIPLVIMAPIPLTLIGILPGHALTGAFFTATSMIGMIALAGIIVRNSILLVDFIQLAQERGRTLREAVIEAGAVRFRPIALTAAAVVIGGLVMVLDPIFQGLAVALISGAIVATLLTMVVVPLLYWELGRREQPELETSHETPAHHIQRQRVPAGA
jgi:multidrug efflux pump subunit AcrB